MIDTAKTVADKLGIEKLKRGADALDKGRKFKLKTDKLDMKIKGSGTWDPLSPQDYKFEFKVTIPLPL